MILWSRWIQQIDGSSSRVPKGRGQFLKNVGPRIPTSGDASRASRARLPGPSRPGDTVEAATLAHENLLKAGRTEYRNFDTIKNDPHWNEPMRR